MALLSLADHSIISHGTFGMWGALLANNGEIIMSKELLNTDIGEKMKVTLDKYKISNWNVL